MKSTLFLKLLGAALLLITVTLFAVDSTITHYAERVGDPAVTEIRERILAISLGAAILALLIAYGVSRSLSSRVTALKQFAETLLETGSQSRPVGGPRDELGALEQSLHVMAARLRESVDRLSIESARREAILSSMAEGVLAVDGGLRITFCNDSFARTIGARMPVPSSMPLLDLVRDPGLLEIMTHVLATGVRVERRLLLPAASAHSFEVLAGPVAGPSNRGALAILHDITQLERLERVRKDFVANVSHELRTPLAAIRGYAETLLDGALEDQHNNRKFVEVIHAHAIRLNNIASDLLTLSELESNGAATPPHRVSVRSTLEAALRTVESGARLRGVRIVAGRIDDVPVMGQELRMEQALVNLLDNAVKFNRPNGEVRIESARSDGNVLIVISDTGLGIPSGDLPRIFERFYRVDKARSREVGGTGLGLSIVKHVVEQMGGTITVDSQLGKGSQFTLLLPAASEL